MRKKIILAAGLIVAIIVAIGGSYYLENNETKKVLTPADITVEQLEVEEEVSVLNKEELNNCNKFLFKDLKGACVYSLNQKYFFVTENSDEQQVICYFECATEENCKPIATTGTGRYMIFKTEQGEKVAAQMKESNGERLIEAGQTIVFDDLAEEEKNSLFELIEE